MSLLLTFLSNNFNLYVIIVFLSNNNNKKIDNFCHNCDFLISVSTYSHNFDHQTEFLAPHFTAAILVFPLTDRPISDGSLRADELIMDTSKMHNLLVYSRTIIASHYAILWASNFLGLVLSLHHNTVCRHCTFLIFPLRC